MKRAPIKRSSHIVSTCNWHASDMLEVIFNIAKRVDQRCDPQEGPSETIKWDTIDQHWVEIPNINSIPM